MGLLTNPSLNQRNKFGRIFVKHNRKISFTIYVIGIIWFICLGHPSVIHSTYLSENALSPGLVYSELKPDSGRLAQSYLEELKKERENHKSNMPYAWVQAKMKQIGLETHVHNFSLKYPFADGKVFQGKNVYGILRAPRVGSTEGIVFSAPYRPPDSVHSDITASVPLLLAFAEFTRRKNYWAKDLIFLITEQEQLGVHAWLEAYYDGGNEKESQLLSGTLPARCGALQAALNLEIQDFDADHIDVKIEGLNGQLPNLDLFNLVQRLAIREGLQSNYKHTKKSKRRGSSPIKDNLRNILSMITTQINGVPTGNHGLFHKHRIESLTLEAVKRNQGGSSKSNMAAVNLLKVFEGISRSLNNLLERFHQSYFFYILVQNDKFISIGDFMPCLILMTAPLFIKAFLLWLDLNNTEESGEQLGNKENHQEIPYLQVLKFMCITGLLGTLAKILPLTIDVHMHFLNLDLTTSVGITLILSIVSTMAVLLPFFTSFNPAGLELLHVASLLSLGSTLLVVGLLNFALGISLATLCCPLAIFVNTKTTAFLKRCTATFTFILNPLVVIYVLVLLLTISNFPELSIAGLIGRAAIATMDGVTYGLIDSVIYGNWLFTVVTAILLPIWTLFWTISTKSFTGNSNDAELKEKKMK